MTSLGEKTIHMNTKNYMAVIDNDEYIDIVVNKKLGNCMYKTAERLNYLVRKYGIDNFGLFMMCCIMKKENKYIRHTAIYNKKQNKIIDVANGKILLVDYDIYLENTFSQTKDNTYRITYLDDHRINMIDFSNYPDMNNKSKSFILNDDNIKEIDNADLIDIIMTLIKSLWKNGNKNINYTD